MLSLSISAEWGEIYIDIFGFAGEEGLKIVEVLKFLADLLLLYLQILMVLFDLFIGKASVEPKTEGEEGDHCKAGDLMILVHYYLYSKYKFSLSVFVYERVDL